MSAPSASAVAVSSSCKRRAAALASDANGSGKKRKSASKPPRTFVCDASRCTMGSSAAVEQPMRERANTKFHATMWAEDFKICKSCVANCVWKCHGDGCVRVDVFGDGAIEPLRFVTHEGDNKLYCPECIEDLWERDENDAEDEQEE